MTRIRQILAGLGALILGGLALLLQGSPAPHSAGLDAAALYLAQHECPDGRLPVEGCSGAVPARPGRLAYTRIDWAGEQRSDAVVAEHLGQRIVAQTFDFGNNPAEAFGRRDRGDGGDAIRVGADGVGIYLTEDPGGGRQWLQGPACPNGAGWLLWRGQPSAEWAEVVVQLGITRAADSCPSSMSLSATRWRLVTLDWAWRDTAGGSGAASRPTIITEHYGGGSRALADHVERFFHAAEQGKVRWERWERVGLSRMADIDGRARATAYRCPGQPEPMPGDWRRVDCRQWTVYDRAGGASIAWP